MLWRKKKKKPVDGGADSSALHWTQKTLAQMTQRDWRIMKEDNNITSKGGRTAPLPLRKWSEANLPEEFMQNLKRVGYVEPTPIQRATIPAGLKRMDLVGIAETGSGKTAAFLLPMLVYLWHLPRLNEETALDGPYCLIMAPSRELAQQILAECESLSYGMGIRAVDIVGGLSIQKQGAEICEGAEVVIGTPGRLLDCINKRYLALNQCYYIVLDEADTMIDMSFEPQIQAVMDAMPATNKKPEFQRQLTVLGSEEVQVDQLFRQTTMFSATMKPSMEKLTKQYLRNPVWFSIGESRDDRINRNIVQKILWVPPGKREEMLKRTMEVEGRVSGSSRSSAVAGKVSYYKETADSFDEPEAGFADPMLEDGMPAIEIVDKKKSQVAGSSSGVTKTIVFCNERNTCTNVARILTDAGYRAVVIYSGLPQERRMSNLSDFKTGKVDILVGTDVVGRGIDVKDVNLVINWDVPASLEKYTHRIGRTGRAGAKGVAISFMHDGDTDIMYDLKEMLLKAGYPMPKELREHPAAKEKQGPPGKGGASGRGGFMQRKGNVLYAKDCRD